jgi:hypothetical protein
MENPEKSFNKYCCILCNYYTSSHKDYIKHNSTRKHQNRTNPTVLEQNVQNKSQIFECECGKKYSARNSLWYHKQKCKLEEQYSDSDGGETIYAKEPSDKDLIMLLIKENSELKNMMMEQSNIMMKVIENGTHNTTNNTNSHNKAFNLNFFLNETCKDAMNIMDFVESIQLQLSDLERVGEIGYVEGISNIIVKNLNELDVSQRPVHCTDKKRETMYIRDENKWEKDESNSKIKKAIKRVASKNQRLLPKFKEAHPDCGTYHSKYSDQYNKIIIESVGGSGDNDAEKEEKIIRNISKNVIVEK